MSDERLFSAKNPWFTGAVAGVVGLLVVSLLIGFIWIPKGQATRNIAGLWESICRAAGAPGGNTPASDVVVGTPASDVIVVPHMVTADTSSVGHGGTLALRCTMCHGVRGTSGADTPNLAGQNADAIYKQLRDFQSGHRHSEIMALQARSLSDQDMRDLAAYYASLPRQTPPANLVEQLRAPRIVQIGAPMRNIAPCAACHGGSEHKTATPLLDGEPGAYLRNQLLAFTHGIRANDIDGQMRNVARHMTPQEIDEAVRYYSHR